MKTLVLICILAASTFAQLPPPTCEQQLQTVTKALADANVLLTMQKAQLDARPKPRSKWKHIQDILERLGIAAGAILLGRHL